MISSLALSALVFVVTARFARLSQPVLWASGAGTALVFLGLAILLFVQYA